MLLVDGVVTCSSEEQQFTLRGEGSYVFLEAESFAHLRFTGATPFLRPAMLRRFTATLIRSGLIFQIRVGDRTLASFGHGVKSDFVARIFKVHGARLGGTPKG
jgi:hypothetical protein